MDGTIEFPPVKCSGAITDYSDKKCYRKFLLPSTTLYILKTAKG